MQSSLSPSTISQSLDKNMGTSSLSPLPQQVQTHLGQPSGISRNNVSTAFWTWHSQTPMWTDDEKRNLNPTPPSPITFPPPWGNSTCTWSCLFIAELQLRKFIGSMFFQKLPIDTFMAPGSAAFETTFEPGETAMKMYPAYRLPHSGSKKIHFKTCFTYGSPGLRKL